MQPKFTKVEWAGPIKEETENILYLPPHIIRLLGLKKDKNYNLQLGSLLTNIVLQERPLPKTRDQKIGCSKALFEQIPIPIGWNLTLRFDGISSLAIGPLIGLLTTQFISPENPENPFGKLSKSLWALCERAKKASCLVYAFAPEDLHFKKGSIRGYLPISCLVEPTSPEQKASTLKVSSSVALETEEVQSWKPLSLPCPDIVYNRIPSRFWEGQENFSSALKYFENRGIVVFNPGFLDKWDVQQRLAVYPPAKEYLPDTVLIEKPEDIANFMSRHRKAFLKPRSGSLGRKIIRISRKGKVFDYKYLNREKETVEKQCETAAQLTEVLGRMMGKREYIIQKTIPLAKYMKQEFDLRLLMQKDRNGEWRRTKAYVRIAHPDGITSNLSSGATAKSIVDVIKTVFNEDFQEPGGFGENITHAAHTIAQAIEKCFPGTWGELGLDLGLDQGGKIWLIEANAKPFKALSSSTGMTQRIERSFLRPLEFAKLLAGFYPHSI